MTVQEELIDPDARVDREFVRARVADWKRRIQNLYTDVSEWLPPGWSAAVDGRVRFREELMERFEVGAEHLPVLVLRSAKQQARMEPRGLWIIGINGRVDLTRGDRHFIIIDRADAFERPDWQVADIGNRQVQRPLDAAVLHDMLG